MEAPPQDPGDVGYCLSVRREPLDFILLQRARAAATVEVVEGAQVTDVLWERDRAAGVALRDGRPRAGRPGRRRRRPPLARRPAGRCAPGARRACAAGALLPLRRGLPRPGRRRCPTPPSSRCWATRWPTSSRATAGSRAWPSPSTSRRSAGCGGTSGHATPSAWRDTAASPSGWALRPPDGRVAGCGPERFHVRVPHGPGWALVGDAALHQDPWSGARHGHGRHARELPRGGDRGVARRRGRRADGDDAPTTDAATRTRCRRITTPCAAPPTSARSSRDAARARRDVRETPPSLTPPRSGTPAPAARRRRRARARPRRTR